MKQPDHKARGFTLIEVVVTLLLLGAISALVSRPLIDLIQARANVSDAAGRQADIDYALARMAKEIRLSTDDEDIKKCDINISNSLEIESNSYKINGDDLVLGEETLVENVGDNDFTCQKLKPQGLYLYELTLTDASVRAFKRDNQ